MMCGVERCVDLVVFKTLQGPLMGGAAIPAYGICSMDIHKIYNFLGFLFSNNVCFRLFWNMICCIGFGFP